MIFEVLRELSADFQSAFLETLQCFRWLDSKFACGEDWLSYFPSDLLKRAILPFAVFFQTVPIIAIALLVIYFGFGTRQLLPLVLLFRSFPSLPIP